MSGRRRCSICGGRNTGRRRAAGNRCGRRRNVGSAAVLNLWGRTEYRSASRSRESLRAEKECRVGGGAQSVGRTEYRSASPRESLRTEKGCRVACRRMRVRAWAASERWLRLKRGRGRMGMSGRLSAGAGTAIRRAASETCLRGRVERRVVRLRRMACEGLRRSLANGWRIVVGEAAGGGSMTGGRVRSGFARLGEGITAVGRCSIGRLRPHGSKRSETARKGFRLRGAGAGFAGPGLAGRGLPGSCAKGSYRASSHPR